MKKKLKPKCQKRTVLKKNHPMSLTGSARAEQCEQSNHFQACRKLFIEALEADIGHELDIAVLVGARNKKKELEIVVVPVSGKPKGLPMNTPMRMASALQESLMNAAMPVLNHNNIKELLRAAIERKIKENKEEDSEF